MQQFTSSVSSFRSGAGYPEKENVQSIHKSLWEVDKWKRQSIVRLKDIWGSKPLFFNHCSSKTVRNNALPNRNQPLVAAGRIRLHNSQPAVLSFQLCCKSFWYQTAVEPLWLWANCSLQLENAIWSAMVVSFFTLHCCRVGVWCRFDVRQTLTSIHWHMGQHLTH